MASPSLSATLNFVKKYPITLCGFSLFFMPSVHRLFLYFTPLLLSTAIFVVAMMSWGPRACSESRSTTRRSKPKIVSEHHEWAFNESMQGIIDEDEDEEEVTTISHEGKAAYKEGITQKEVDVGLKWSEQEQEADPDVSEDSGPVQNSNCQAVPATPAASVDVLVEGAKLLIEPDPDLQGEDMKTNSKDGDVDLVLHAHAHHLDSAAHSNNDDGDARPPHGFSHCAHDDSHPASYASHAHVHDDDDDDDDGHASHTQDHYKHKHLPEGVPKERAVRFLRVCA